jgi:hypothetical protein
MRSPTTLAAFGLVVALAVYAVPGGAQNSSARYNACQAQAAQQSGWNGSMQSGSQHAPLAGAAGGALGGSLIGGMGGGDAGRGAAIGAAFGAVFGTARKDKAASKQQQSQENYYNILNQCMQQ